MPSPVGSIPTQSRHFIPIGETMKVVLAAPNMHQPRGNTVTVQRISEELENCGVKTDIISTSEDRSFSALSEADIVHGFHAYHFYQFMQRFAGLFHSYIVTLTGTDISHDLFDKNRREDVIQCLVNAGAIHVFDDEARQMLHQEIPAIAHKIFTIHQGVRDFPKACLHIEKEDNTFLFVLPAGIRKVKNMPFAIKNLRSLYEKNPGIRLWLVGPIIEPEEGRKIQTLVEENKDWVRYIDNVPHEKMGAIYEQADVMLNTSHSEGQSSAILEAMSYGVPVLASNNAGNRYIIHHQQTGLLYDDEEEFLDYARAIINNKEQRQQVGQWAQKYIAEHHSSQYEVEMLLAMYRNL